MTTDAEIIEAMARAEVDPGDGSIKPDLKYVLIRGFHAMGWERPADATINMIEAAFTLCAPAIRAQAMEEAAKVAERFLIYVTVCNPGAVADAIRTAALAPPAVAEKGESNG